MTRDDVLELFEYNAWANRLLFEASAKLSEADYLHDLKSSFGGIHGTLAHIVWAEHLWLTRWTGKPAPAIAQGRDLPGLPAVRTRWEDVEAERREWLRGLTDAQLEETRVVKPSTGGEFVHTMRQMIRHVVDHSSYHRGQVVTLFRQVGAVPPVTGLIFFYRQRLT